MCGRGPVWEGGSWHVAMCSCRIPHDTDKSLERLFERYQKSLIHPYRLANGRWSRRPRVRRWRSTDDRKRRPETY